MSSARVALPGWMRLHGGPVRTEPLVTRAWRQPCSCQTGTFWMTRRRQGGRRRRRSGRKQAGNRSRPASTGLGRRILRSGRRDGERPRVDPTTAWSARGIRQALLAGACPPVRPFPQDCVRGTSRSTTCLSQEAGHLLEIERRRGCAPGAVRTLGPESPLGSCRSPADLPFRLTRSEVPQLSRHSGRSPGPSQARLVKEPLPKALAPGRHDLTFPLPHHHDKPRNQSKAPSKWNLSSGIPSSTDR